MHEVQIDEVDIVCDFCVIVERVWEVSRRSWWCSPSKFPGCNGPDEMVQRSKARMHDLTNARSHFGQSECWTAASIKQVSPTPR